MHSINAVVMPPDTYHTLLRALRSDTALSQTAAQLNLGAKAALGAAGTAATVVAPTNSAWLAMAAGPTTGWLGGLATATVKRTPALAAAIAKYLVLRVPGTGEALSRDQVIAAWRRAGSRSLLAATTDLVVDGEAQRVLLSYNEASDSLYVLGPRNLNSAPTIAAATAGAGARTLYAGCSTVLVVDGFVPLPLKTGLPKFDTVAPPAWW